MINSESTALKRIRTNICRSIFGILLTGCATLIPPEIQASQNVTCPAAIGTETTSTLGIQWTPYRGSKVYALPEVFADPYIQRAQMDEGFRKYLVSEIKAGRAVITDYKQIADAEPLYAVGAQPKLPAGVVKATPADLSYPQLVEYITINYRLPHEAQGQALFSEGEKKIYSPIMMSLARLNMAPRFQSKSAYPGLVEAAAKKVHDTWESLLRYTPQKTRTTLLPLPNKYVVAGGRFRESYYWDSLWIMKGLVESGYNSTARGMLENYVHLFEEHGIIPNGNRFYYLTRTQVPVFMEMVAFLESKQILNFNGWNAKNPKSLEARVLKVAEEYYNNIWKGTNRFNPETGLFTYSDGADGFKKPGETIDPYKAFRRPERGILEPGNLERISQREFAESGWDMSYSRFGREPGNWHPVDLNFLLMNYTKNLSRLFEQAGMTEKSKLYASESQRIRNQLQKHLWDAESGLYVDFNFKNRKLSDTKTAASFFAFYTGAYPKNAESQKNLRNLIKELKPEGHLGIHTTNKEGEGQWDGPWSWAPLVETAFQSALKYDLNEEATKIALDYSTMVITSFHKNKEVFFEKYHGKDGTIDLPEDTEIYGNETGFGWTNGTLAVFLKHLEGQGALPTLEKEIRKRLER